MPYTTYVASTKQRILISGFPNSGKTTCLPTFLYGDHDYWSENVSEHTAAVEHAHDYKMVIISCPGETGIKSLPTETKHITCYAYESPAEGPTSMKYSVDVLKEFTEVLAMVTAGKPNILALDGIHGLWDHLMNRGTSGEYLAGLPVGDDGNPFSSARLYSQTHKAFGQFMAGLYHSPIHTIIATVLEDWEAGSGNNTTRTPLPRTAPRYLWPAIPGEMAKKVVSRFDARLSCRMEEMCLHGRKLCKEFSHKHFVWQFYPKGDVAGVGIKGMKLTKQMMDTPYIHQSAVALEALRTKGL